MKQFTISILLLALLTLTFAEYDFQTSQLYCPNGAQGEWSQWFNRDYPSSTGDWEVLDILVQNGQVCQNPIDINCETVQGLPASATGENLIIDPARGCICINKEQKDGMCNYDYRVQFKCCPSCPSGYIGQWTQFLDRDNPSGSGDWEVLDIFIDQGKVCREPIDAICRAITGESIAQTGEIVSVSPKSGCICQHKLQPDGRCDYDYEVKFLCCENICPINQFPTWSRWLDRDNTSGDGDYETVKDFLNEHNPYVCKQPLGIQCQTLDGIPADQTGQIVTIDPFIGCFCRNSLQPDGKCDYDYKVRFLCCQHPTIH